MSVEITDTGRWRLRQANKLEVVCQSLFPRPIRFREVWKQVRTVPCVSFVFGGAMFGLSFFSSFFCLELGFLERRIEKSR